MSIEITKKMSDKAYSYINLDYMEMMADGDDSMKKVMLEMLLEELPQELQKMNGLNEQGDWAELCSVSHKMKSTLAFVGNEVLTQSNKDIEAFTKERQELDRIPVLIATMLSVAPNAVAELKVEFDRL